jgi:hypothetical protein
MEKTLAGTDFGKKTAFLGAKNRSKTLAGPKGKNTKKCFLTSRTREEASGPKTLATTGFSQYA